MFRLRGLTWGRSRNDENYRDYRWRRRRLYFKLTCVLLLLVFVFVPPARNWVVGGVLVHVPVSTEVNMGRKIFQRLRSRSRFIENPALTERLAAITGPLLKALPEDERQYPFQFHIAADTSVNAYAVPGGHIVLHSGLILAAQSPEEIAGVLAHEVGHVTGRHSLRHIADDLGTRILLALIFDARGDWDYVAEAGGALLASTKFSRDHETEADARGFGYLRTARIDPRGLIGFFERLEAQRPSPSGGTAAALHLLNTHPLPGERKEELKRLAAENTKDTSFVRLDFALPDFQARLREELAKAR